PFLCASPRNIQCHFLAREWYKYEAVQRSCYSTHCTSYSLSMDDSLNHPLWPSFKARVVSDLDNKLRQLQSSQAANVIPPVFNPNQTFQMHKEIEWLEGGFKHGFQYSLQHDAPSAQYRSAKYRVYGKLRVTDLPHYQIGHVVIDALLYDPTEPLRDRLTDGKVMLSLMKESVRLDRAIRLGYEVHPMVGQDDCITGSVERIVARTPPAYGEPSLKIQTFRERSIPRRMCMVFGCGALLPVAGPDQCLDHIITPPGN
ncbi:hypothetical protein FB451DRAFT_676007, partial [Mycena latifolia]